MWKPACNSIHFVYRRYREWVDVRRLSKKYPERAEYKDLCCIIEDECDIDAYEVAKSLCDISGVSISEAITHIKSLMYRYYTNNLSLSKCNGIYTQHYYDKERKLWMYRDGTTQDIIRPTDLMSDVGAPLLNDIPPGQQGEWLLPN